MIHPVIDLDIPETVGGLVNVQTMRRIEAVLQAQRSAFYRGKLDDLDIDNVCRPEEWAKIPILDRAQLKAMSAEEFRDDFCIGSRQDRVEYWRAGQGVPHLYPRTRKDIVYAKIGCKRALVLAGFTEDDVALMSMPLGMEPWGQLMARSGSEIGIGMLWAGGGDTLPPEAQLEMLREVGPSAWIGAADHGIGLGNLARSEGMDLPGASIGKMLCSGAPLSDVKRRKLGALCGAELRDCFGLAEVMTLGCEDAECYGFRFWSDYCYPEVLDKSTLEPVGEGETGVLVVTPLVTNNATPFLRWNTGEVVTMRSMKRRRSPFDVFPIIKHVHRAGGRLEVRGVSIGIGDLEDVLWGAPEVADFRCEVVSEGEGDELDLHLEVHPGAERVVIEKRVAELVYRAVGLQPRVKAAGRGEIARAFGRDLRLERFRDMGGGKN